MFELVKTRNTLDAQYVADLCRELTDLDLSGTREAFNLADEMHQTTMKGDSRSLALLQIIDGIAYLRFGGKWRAPPKAKQKEARKRHYGHILTGILAATFFHGHRSGH